MKHLFSLIAFLLFCHLTKAQDFFIPSTKDLSGKLELQTVNGRTIVGVIGSTNTTNDYITSFKIKDSATGESVKIKIEEVKVVKIKMDAQRKSEIYDKEFKKNSLLTGNQVHVGKEYIKDYVYFYPITYPGKKDIYLSQIINPDFSSKIQVYEGDPKFNEKKGVLGLRMVTNIPQNFILVINGVSSFVKSKNYKTEYFDKLFASCPELMAMTEKDAVFENFEKHVSIFDKCK
jgi:hypothetical protein